MSSIKTPVHAINLFPLLNHVVCDVAFLHQSFSPIGGTFSFTSFDPIEVLLQFALLLTFSFQLVLQSLNKILCCRAHWSYFWSPSLTGSTSILAMACLAPLTSSIVSVKSTWLFTGCNGFIGPFDCILKRQLLIYLLQYVLVHLVLCHIVL